MLSDAQLVRSLSLRSRVAIKRELQRLVSEHDAAAAFLWTATAHGDRALTIEAVGDREAQLRSANLAGPISYVCDQRTLRSNGGTELPTVLLYSQLCKDAPTFILGLIDPAAPYADVITEDLEQAMARVESIIVDTLDPPLDTQRTAKASGSRTA